VLAQRGRGGGKGRGNREEPLKGACSVNFSTAGNRWKKEKSGTLKGGGGCGGPIGLRRKGAKNENGKGARQGGTTNLVLKRTTSWDNWWVSGVVLSGAQKVNFRKVRAKPHNLFPQGTGQNKWARTNVEKEGQSGGILKRD